MTVTVARFHNTLSIMGSDVTYHREEGGTACPCRTPEGFRSQDWHRDNPTAPVCNEEGFLAVTVTEFVFKGTVQPAIMAYYRNAQRVNALLGEVERDDRFGIFPVHWQGHTIDLDDWSAAAEDYIIYDGDRYVVVSADKLADVDGVPDHHWECGLRLAKLGRPSG